jgi:N-acetylglutamate synthase-like GNAT family acetyltransferase
MYRRFRFGWYHYRKKPMPRFYIEEYTCVLSGKRVSIACREGILRDHLEAIVTDIKFLDRYGIHTKLYHNMANRFANQHVFRHLSERLPRTRIVRLLPDLDFYSQVLDAEEDVYKVIFLERKALVDHKGRKINALTTQGVRDEVNAWGDLIANVNFKSVMERICSKIESGQCDRVHILPAGKNAIKNELFTIEGYGTLVANNFEEYFQSVSDPREVSIIDGILKLYRHEGFLKPRTESYLREHYADFYITLIDNIVVGCVEKKIIDRQTVEIGALAISTRFRNQRIGLYTVQAFMETMSRQGFRCFVSLTNNPALQKLFTTLGFRSARDDEYTSRQGASPGVVMYVKRDDSNP